MNTLSDILRANGDLLCVAGTMLTLAVTQWIIDAVMRRPSDDRASDNPTKTNPNHE